MAGTSELSEILLSVVDDRRATAALHAQGWSGSSDPAELRRVFDAAARADYQRGETVSVAGWQLARSQANLCAPAYFSMVGLL